MGRGGADRCGVDGCEGGWGELTTAVSMFIANAEAIQLLRMSKQP